MYTTFIYLHMYVLHIYVFYVHKYAVCEFCCHTLHICYNNVFVIFVVFFCFCFYSPPTTHLSCDTDSCVILPKNLSGLNN